MHTNLHLRWPINTNPSPEFAHKFRRYKGNKWTYHTCECVETEPKSSRETLKTPTTMPFENNSNFFMGFWRFISNGKGKSKEHNLGNGAKLMFRGHRNEQGTSWEISAHYTVRSLAACKSNSSKNLINLSLIQDNQLIKWFS